MTSALKRLLLLALLAAAGCAQQQPTFDQVSASLPPVPVNAARIFVYRAFEPYQSLSWVPIFFNGATVGAVGPGHVVMRDVPPGTYVIEPKSEGLWPEQAKTVTVGPGQTVYAKVESFKGLDPTANHREALLTTFVVVLMDTATGRREIGPLWYDAAQAGAAVASRALGADR